MKQGVLLSSLLLLLSAGASAQTNFQPGYVLPLSGDTLRGQVDARGAQRNARLSRFRPADGAAVTEYQPTQLRGYGFTNDRAYQTGTVPLPEVVKRRSALDVVEAAVEQPAFLEVLVLGPASLLYLRDANNKDHYYLRLQADGVVQELVTATSQSQLSGEADAQQANEYKRTLAAAMKACLVVQPQVNRMRYSQIDLIKVVTQYNNCVGGASVAPASASRKNRVRLGVVAGVHSSQIRFANYARGSRFDMGSSPAVGLALQMSLTGVSRMLSTRVEALYTSGQGAGQYDYRDAFGPRHGEQRFKVSSVHLPVSLRYTFPRGTLRPFVQVGYSFNFFLQVQDDYRERYTDGIFMDDYKSWKPITSPARAFETGINGGLGLTTARADARNLAVELRYARTSGFSENADIRNSFQRYFLLLSYDLTK